MADELREALHLVLMPLPGVMFLRWGLVAMGVGSGLVALLAWRGIRGRAAKGGWAAVVVVAACAAVLYRSAQPERYYYLHVDELVDRCAAMQGKKLQVNGVVSCGSLVRQVGAKNYHFAIQTIDPRPLARIEARYTGILPDRFQEGAEVVIQGRLAEGGVFDVTPDGVMTKCPSKYDGPYPPVPALPCGRPESPLSSGT